jgi:mRNA interferase MazF
VIQPSEPPGRKPRAVAVGPAPMRSCCTAENRLTKPRDCPQLLAKNPTTEQTEHTEREPSFFRVFGYSVVHKPRGLPDFVWISLSPTSGHEQAGRRPGLVISPKSYNRKSGLCVLCPATLQAKGYTFEVAIARDDESSGIVLADHLRNVDWKARNIQFIHRVSDSELSEVIARIEALLISPDV